MRIRRHCLAILLLASASTLGATAIGGCRADPMPGLVPNDHPITQPAEPTRPPPTAPSTLPAASDKPQTLIAPPGLDATQPCDLPGLHNVVAYAPDIYSGSVPEGPQGFETLSKMGIRTVLSVDGAEPELQPATALGLRYVHLPITYSGFSDERRLELAKALRDLPKPIYVHCHHGKHRSAGAAASALVSLGILTPEQGVARMRVSGTAPDYKGLYACTENATKVMPAVLDTLQVDFGLS